MAETNEEIPFWDVFIERYKSNVGIHMLDIDILKQNIDRKLEEKNKEIQRLQEDNKHLIERNVNLLKRDLDNFEKLKDILERATRHQRANKEQQYLLMDLEYIEEHIEEQISELFGTALVENTCNNCKGNIHILCEAQLPNQSCNMWQPRKEKKPHVKD